MSTRPKIQCRACRHQVSLTAGTIFHATKLPLTSWFLAMWLITTAKNGISSVELGRRLGIKQTNAWAMKQKIVAVMAGREDKRRLDGRVEMDDVYLGGHRPGKRGRGAAGKQPFVAPYRSVRPPPTQDQALAGQGLPQEGGQEACGQAPGFDQPARDRWAALLDRRGRGRAGAHRDRHRQRQTGRPRSPIKWVNTSLGNVEAAITGTYRHVSPEHAGRYLASFAWRFNRRFQLTSLIPRLVHSAVRTAPLPYHELVTS